jgi:hypothetical protein
MFKYARVQATRPLMPGHGERRDIRLPPLRPKAARYFGFATGVNRRS